ncbi:hypothetical protein SDC9_116247 [bioreactor metagenome]|uniref:Uncharacterized protein n=1 Tax=bioreactor metagenome TaxID=1076179 RepID=A0A645BVL8_9ZZZZ
MHGAPRKGGVELGIGCGGGFWRGRGRGVFADHRGRDTAAARLRKGQLVFAHRQRYFNCKAAACGPARHLCAAKIQRQCGVRRAQHDHGVTGDTGTVRRVANGKAGRSARRGDCDGGVKIADQ